MDKTKFDQLLESEAGLSEQFKNGAFQILEEAVKDESDSAVKEAMTKVTSLEEALKEKETALTESVAQKEEIEKQLTESTQSLETTKAELETVKSLVEGKETELTELNEELAKTKATLTEKEEANSRLVESLQELTEKHRTLEESMEKEIASKVAEYSNELSERLSTYADFVAEQYVSSHEEAIVEESKTLVSEGILESIKNVFAKYGFEPVEHLTCVNEQLEETKKELSETYDRLTEALESKQELMEKLENKVKESIFEEHTKGLTELNKNKVRDLLENANYDVSEFENKVTSLVESFKSVENATVNESISNTIVSDSVPLNESKVEDKSEQANQEMQKTEELDPDVAFFMRAFKRLK